MIIFSDIDTVPFAVGGLLDENIILTTGVKKHINVQDILQDVFKSDESLQYEDYSVIFRSAQLTSDQVAWFEDSANKEITMTGTVLGTVRVLILGDIELANITKLTESCFSYDLNFEFVVIGYGLGSSSSSSSSSSSASSEESYLVDELGNFLIDENGNKLISGD